MDPDVEGVETGEQCDCTLQSSSMNGKCDAASGQLIEISPLDLGVVTCGRVVPDAAEGTLRFDWTGTRICFRVVGAPERVSLRMDFQDDFFNVYIDGVRFGVFGPGKPGFQDYLLVDKLQRNATIAVHKRTEGCGCPVVLSKIILTRQIGGSDPALGVPPAVPTRAIEFIGDSDTAAFANLCKRTPPSESFGHEQLRSALPYTDVESGWAAFVSHAFDAVPHTIALSGISAALCPDGSDPPTPMTVNYQRMLAMRSSRTSRYLAPQGPPLDVVDVVVVYLGGNDYVEAWNYWEEDFIDGYAKLLQMVMFLRPRIPILCLTANLTSGSSCYDKEDQASYSNMMKRLVSQAVERVGGSSAGVHATVVHPTPPIDIDDDADWAGYEHWSIQGHEKWARGVVPALRDLMKWDVKNIGILYQCDGSSASQTGPRGSLACLQGSLFCFDSRGATSNADEDGAKASLLPSVWEVVGGKGSGGILVRAGKELSSPRLCARLATGAIVEAVQLEGDRLHYRLLQGDGPCCGWVTFQIKDHHLLRRRALPAGGAWAML